MPNSEQQDLERYKEKQKTIRVTVFLLVLFVIAMVAMYILYQRTSEGGKGSVAVDLQHGTVSLNVDKPIVEQIQINKSTVSAQDKNIQVTEGKIKDPEVIKEINSLSSIQPTQFSGKNFINREAGFLFTVRHPENWQVTYNPAGMSNGAIAVNTIYSREGAHLNVGVSPILPGLEIQQYVAQNVQSMIQTGMITQWPVVSYDLPSQTAFAVITNPYTAGQSYQKVVIDSRRQRVFVASANYNQSLSSAAVIQELVNMIATFTVIGE